jgi:hypothetical protein
MDDAARRTIRTLIQVIIAQLCVALITFLVKWQADPDHIPSLAALGTAGWNIAITVAIPAITFVQNNLESLTNFPAFLKSPPSAGKNPVPKDAGVGPTRPGPVERKP